MKIIGIDPASNMGWSVIEDGNLIQSGEILCQRNLSIEGKMYYYNLKLKQVFEQYKPDYCGIEDIIMAISGVKTLIYLTRINSAAILAALDFIEPENVHLYTPSEWKKLCPVNGINGDSKKWEILVSICLHYNLLDISNDIVTDYKKLIETSDKNKKILTNNIGELNIKCQQLKQAMNRKKRDVLTPEQKTAAADYLKQFKQQIHQMKKEIKSIDNQLKKDSDKIINRIYTKTGISTDIADSIGVALTLNKQILHGVTDNG